MYQANQTSYPTNTQATAVGPAPVATIVHTMAVHNPPHTAPVTNQKTVHMPGHDSEDEREKPCNRAWLIFLGTLGTVVTVAILILLLLRKNGPTSSSNEQRAAPPLPSSAPTTVGDEECRRKRIKITEICNAHGLDDELVELKVLVNDQPYWPKQVESDCLEGYGSDGRDTCVVPNSSLVGCFKLPNSIEIPFGSDDVEVGASVEEQIKITIIDEDFFWDDIIEIFVAKSDWYRPNLCEKKELEFAEHSYEGSTKIKMVVDFGQVENPCGVEKETLLSGLNDTVSTLESVQFGLLEYTRGIDELKRRLQTRQVTAQQRRLIFPLLATGFRFMAGAVSTGGRSFVKLFTRQTRVGNTLSTTADMAEIGTFLLSFLGDDDDGGSSSSNGSSSEILLDRFDQIDRQLSSLSAQIQEGFESMKLTIEREFAETELDKWINFYLEINLRGSYSGYTNRLNTASSRVRNEERFRQTCNGDHSPYNILQVLYSYSCLDCSRYSGKAQQYFLDTYVNLAKTNFDDPMDRVLWFRKTFGTVIIGALTEAIYFHSVCLYRSKDDDECETNDPVRDARLEEMGNALEEVVESLGEAEDRLV